MKYFVNIDQKTIFEIAPQLNFNDCAILDYVINYCKGKSSNIKRIKHKGYSYTWIDYQTLTEEMPLLHFESTDPVYRRLTKLIEAGFLDKTFDKNKQPFFKTTPLADKLKILQKTDENSRSKSGIDEPNRSKERSSVSFSDGEVSAFETDRLIYYNNNINNTLRASARAGTTNISEKKNLNQEEKHPDFDSMIEIMDIFRTTNDDIKQLYPNKTQQKAVYSLFDRYGINKVIAAAKYAVSVQNVLYAPVITTPCMLKTKFTALAAHYDRQKQQQNSGGRTIIGTDFSKQ